MKIPAALLFATLALCGCGALQQAVPSAAPVTGAALQGSVHGGQQPVYNSSIQLYAVSTAADGAIASPLLVPGAVKSLANGSFTITAAYTCTPGALLYLTATGGNPGLSPITTNNGALSMMTLVGACGATSMLPATAFYSINELTTVAAVTALAPYMNSYTQVGYSASTDATAFSTAYALAAELVNPTTGTAPGATAPGGYTVPIAELNTLANILAGCINTPGGTASDGTACGSLLLYATPPGGAAPTETIGAMLNIAKFPNQNVTSLFGLATASVPFQPTMSVAPADWTVPLLPTGATRILFVGDSFTHGRYTPVRNYNSANVTDENYGLPSTNVRAESSTEPGPYGGIPGIFKMFTTEAGLKYDVHIYTISATSLASLYSDAPSVVANPQWNAVVLQELSTRPISKTLSGTSSSNPGQFCSSVKTIEQAVHGVNVAAGVYEYGTWARADTANANETANTTAAFTTALQTLTTAYHSAFYGAAANDGLIAGVASTGDAWQLAINSGYVGSDPFLSSTGPFLWYGLNATNNPTITVADEYHPSIYGAYLSALVLYGQITGQDPAALGSAEAAAASLGISSTLATQLQATAHTQVYSGSTAYTSNPNPCTIQ